MCAERTRCAAYWEHGPSHIEHVRARVRLLLLWLVLQSAAVPASRQGAQHVASIPSVAAAAVGAAPAAVAVAEAATTAAT